MEAEKKLRQSEPGTVSGDLIPKEEVSKVDNPLSSKKYFEVAMIKLRMPNGKVPDEKIIKVIKIMCVGIYIGVEPE